MSKQSIKIPQFLFLVCDAYYYVHINPNILLSVLREKYIFIDVRPFIKSSLASIFCQKLLFSMTFVNFAAHY